LKLHFTKQSEFADVDEFDCDNQALNSFLKDLSLLFQRRHFGVTILCFKEEDLKKIIIGYYTLCPASVQREALPEKFLTGPKPNPIPALRLCRLAIDKRFQNQGYGKILFVHALKKYLDQSKQIGGSIIIIDAKDTKAKQFYEHFGFLSLPSNPFVLIQTIKYIEHHFA